MDSWICQTLTASPAEPGGVSLRTSKHEYLRLEDIVHRESHTFHGNSHGRVRAGHQTCPADPNR